jgi:hypothetical protein
MKDIILTKFAYSYNLEGQKTWRDSKADDEISSKTTEHRNGLVVSSPPNWRQREGGRTMEQHSKTKAWAWAWAQSTVFSTERESVSGVGGENLFTNLCLTNYIDRPEVFRIENHIFNINFNL